MAIVQLEYDELANNEVDHGRGCQAIISRLTREASDIRTKCVNGVSKHSFYQYLQNNQLQYRSTFSLVDDIFWDGDDLSTARIHSPPSTMPFEHVTTHPAVLDACCQVCFIAPSNGMSSSLPTAVPHRMENIWLSAKGWQKAQQIQVSTRSQRKSILPGIEGSLTALGEDRSLLCHFKRIKLLPISGQKLEDEDIRALCHFINWQPDLSLLSRERLRDFCNAGNSDVDESTVVAYCTELETTLLTVLQRNIRQLQHTD